MTKNIYDLSYWLKLDCDPEQEEKRILELLQNNNCEIKLNLDPKKKNLAYPINKETSGYFGTVYFCAEKDVVPKLEKSLLTFANVLRFLIVKRKTLPQVLKNTAESQTEVIEQKQEEVTS